MVGAVQLIVSGVPCGLGVKLNALNDRFSKKDEGVRMASSVMLFADILSGLDNLQKLEQSACPINLAA